MKLSSKCCFAAKNYQRNTPNVMQSTVRLAEIQPVPSMTAQNISSWNPAHSTSAIVTVKIEN